MRCQGFAFVLYTLKFRLNIFESLRYEGIYLIFATHELPQLHPRPCKVPYSVMESSRIFVRGLPPNLTADDFRLHFSKQAAITDAKYIPHRRIGYVGYKTYDEAARAVKYFNKSFIRMSRIGVELARSVRL